VGEVLDGLVHERLVLEAAALSGTGPGLAGRGGDQALDAAGERGGRVLGDVALDDRVAGGVRGTAGRGVPLQADVRQAEHSQALAPAARAGEEIHDLGEVAVHATAPSWGRWVWFPGLPPHVAHVHTAGGGVGPEAVMRRPRLPGRSTRRSKWCGSWGTGRWRGRSPARSGIWRRGLPRGCLR